MGQHATIPVAKLQRSAATSLTCEGCRNNWYSAPGGQRTYPGAPAILSQPHSRCTALQAHVPMILGEHGKWLGSEIPDGCPEHQQPGLF